MFVQHTYNAIKTVSVDRLTVNVYNNRTDLGNAAGTDVVHRMKQLLEEKKTIRMLFGAAPSANEFLAYLAAADGIDWSRVEAFHMDEYIGLAHGAPETFAHFLNVRLFDVVKPGKLHVLAPGAAAEAECARYGALIDESDFDIVCLGMGENGHIAFNDPPVADFYDPHTVKIVELDAICRQQQVNDGCFPNLSAVPTHAVTITIPPMLRGAYLYSVVPGPTKSRAVKAALTGPISTECPASIIRTHPRCVLYVDRQSYGLVEPL